MAAWLLHDCRGCAPVGEFNGEDAAVAALGQREMERAGTRGCFDGPDCLIERLTLQHGAPEQHAGQSDPHVAGAYVVYGLNQP